MANLTTIVSNIRSTASGPTMREKIAQGFEAARDGYTTESFTKTVACAAGAAELWNFSISKFGYTPIGVVSAYASNLNTIVGDAYIYSTSSAKLKTYNLTESNISATLNITVLYKNNNNA